MDSRHRQDSGENNPVPGKKANRYQQCLPEIFTIQHRPVVEHPHVSITVNHGIGISFMGNTVHVGVKEAFKQGNKGLPVRSRFFISQGVIISLDIIKIIVLEMTSGHIMTTVHLQILKIHANLT